MLLLDIVSYFRNLLSIDFTMVVPAMWVIITLPGPPGNNNLIYYS